MCYFGYLAQMGSPNYFTPRPVINSYNHLCYKTPLLSVTNWVLVSPTTHRSALRICVCLASGIWLWLVTLTSSISSCKRQKNQIALQREQGIFVLIFIYDTTAGDEPEAVRVASIENIHDYTFPVQMLVPPTTNSLEQWFSSRINKMCNNSLANNVILACLPASMSTSVRTKTKEQ